jgi:cellobiose-specific phosphotransferase system component IIC
MVGRVNIPGVIALFLSGVFLNFVLPIRAGELVKSVALKRNARIPFSQSLPTITMDKVQYLLPAFFIVIMVPLLGVQLDRIFP